MNNKTVTPTNSVIWIGSNNRGKKTTLIKIDQKKWIESNQDGIFRFTQKEHNEVKNEYLLEDENRSGYYIKLTTDRCFLKTPEFDFVLIYKGKALDGNFMN